VHELTALEAGLGAYGGTLHGASLDGHPFFRGAKRNVALGVGILFDDILGALGCDDVRKIVGQLVGLGFPFHLGDGSTEALGYLVLDFQINLGEGKEENEKGHEQRNGICIGAIHSSRAPSSSCEGGGGP
jgi:hypothetical protein